MKTKISEYILGAGILGLFLVHTFGYLDQSMMFSGILVTVACAFIALVVTEAASDERDEFIRAKTDRYLFLFTMSALTLSVIWKTFGHQDYFDELLFLATLSCLKLFLSKFLNESN